MADKTYTFHLIIHGPDDYSSEYEIPIGITTIGRESDNLIQLNDRTISRHHGRLECIAGECDIIDFDSSNGTYVNGVKIAANTPVILKHEDRIGLGPNYELQFLQIEALEEAPPVEEPEPLPPMDLPEPADVLDSGEPQPPEPPVAALPPAPSPDGASELIPPGLSLDSRLLLKYLPGIYHTEFMRRFLGIFEAILMPIEWTIDNFDLYLSPRTVPSGFLPWLANWYEAAMDSTWSESQRRQFLEEAWQLYARRGTKWALSRILEIYTGQIPQIDDLADDLRPHTFRVTLSMPEENANRASIESLINDYKPAYTDYEIYFQG
jgi:phage tail-like protein